MKLITLFMLCLLQLASAGGRVRRQEGIFTRALRALSFADRTSSSYVAPEKENKTNTSGDDDDDDDSSSSDSTSGSSSSTSSSSSAISSVSTSTSTSTDSSSTSSSTDSSSSSGGSSGPAPAPPSTAPMGNSTSVAGNGTNTAGDSTNTATTNSDSTAVFNSTVAANISMDEEGNLTNSSKTETLLPEEGPQPDSWPWIMSFVFLALAAIFLSLTCLKSCKKGSEYEEIPNVVV